MGDDKRLFLFLALVFAFMLLWPRIATLIFGPPPQPAQPPAKQVAQKAEPKNEIPPDKVEKPPVVVEAGEAAALNNLPEQPEQELISVTMGSTNPESGYKAEIVASNHGAVVTSIRLADYLKEKIGAAADQDLPLPLINPNEGSYGISIAGTTLLNRNWEVVTTDKDDDGIVNRVVFRTSLKSPTVRITKTIFLPANTHIVDYTLKFENVGTEPIGLSYQQHGPRGVELEGEWYARKFRDAVIGGGIQTDINRQTTTARTLAGVTKELRDKYDNQLKFGGVRRDGWNESPSSFDRFDVDKDENLNQGEVIEAAKYLAGIDESWTNADRPVRFAGVEGQYFASLIIIPEDTDETQHYRSTTPVTSDLNAEELDHSDVSFVMESREWSLGAGEKTTHQFLIYSGPRKKTTMASELVAAEIDEETAVALAHEATNDVGWVLFIPAGLVSFTSGALMYMLNIFHAVVGNWGVAILMLTVMVRMAMFPMSRKQAMSAHKMQALKPEMDALKEKHKDEKEKLSKAQFELWRKHGVNPLGGCLPLFIQMPIFIGLWQGLSHTVDLRQAKFFGWIDNLAAPDALFSWGVEIPLVSNFLGPHFNLLPVLLMGLMLVQQKLFMPQSDDPQMQMQQKMMTLMMVFFGFIFYRLPSGLCLYYIMSTSWGIAERKFIPKVAAKSEATSANSTSKKATGKDADGNGKMNGKGGGRGTKRGKVQPAPEPKRRTFMDKVREIIESADKNKRQN